MKGEEEIGISKNILLMMRYLYAYLPKVHQFIYKTIGLNFADISYTTDLNYTYWQNQFKNLKIGSTYEKGKRLEDLVQYLFNTVSGLKVTGARLRGERSEIDIFCCNISYDFYLWSLGTLILIECKNRKNKVRVSEIRNLVPIMEAKGIIGAIIFSRSGFTKPSLKEIKYQLFGGKKIIPISLDEVNEISREKSIYKLIREKVECFDNILKNNDQQLYF